MGVVLSIVTLALLAYAKYAIIFCIQNHRVVVLKFVTLVILRVPGGLQLARPLHRRVVVMHIMIMCLQVH